MPNKLAWAALLVAAGCGDSPRFKTPLSISNCGGACRFERPPRRAVALNQTAAELLIALELGEAIVATGLQDNPPTARFAAEYEAIPLHWSGYPPAHDFVRARPDFAYATLASAFHHDVTRARATLEEFGIEIYVSPSACVATPAGEAPTFSLVEREIGDVAAIFGVEDRGRELLTSLRQRLDAVRTAAAQRPGPDPVVAWYVSGLEEPLFGAGGGVLRLATEAARADQVFAESGGSFVRRSWAEFVAEDANWIGIVDELRTPAAAKQSFLASHPDTAGLRAVREERFVVVPFSSTLPGVGVVDVAEALAAAIATDAKAPSSAKTQR